MTAAAVKNKNSADCVNQTIAGTTTGFFYGTDEKANERKAPLFTKVPHALGCCSCRCQARQDVRRGDPPAQSRPDVTVCHIAAPLVVIVLARQNDLFLG